MVMDASSMYPSFYHPLRIPQKWHLSGKNMHFTRTQRPTKYYYIDFGISRRFNPEDGPPLEYPILGIDKSVPEFKVNPCALWDPFPTDVYYLGNMVRMNFVRVRANSPLTCFMLTFDHLYSSPSRNVLVSNLWKLSLPIWSKLIPRTVRP
jgi:hypothetical protein